MGELGPVDAEGLKGSPFREDLAHPVQLLKGQGWGR